MKKLLTAAFVLLLAPAAMAQDAPQMTPYQEMPAGVYKVDPAHASIAWKVMHAGLSGYLARFTDFDITLTYDPENPAQSKIIATIDPASISTEYPNMEEKNFNKELATNPDWFNAGEHPEIRFESTAIELTGDNTAKVTGDLSFLGVSKPVTLDVVLNGAMASQPFSGKPTFGFSAQTSLERSQWGMTKYVPTIGDEVVVMIEAELPKETPEEPATE